MLKFAVTLVLLLQIAALVHSYIDDSKTNQMKELWADNGATNSTGEWQQSSSENNGATCYDRKISSFIDTALGHYSHDMGALSKYILDQIVRARYSGSWLIHAEMVGSQRQGLEWQSATNGDLFAASSRHGCYYHDTQTYIIIVRY